MEPMGMTDEEHLRSHTELRIPVKQTVDWPNKQREKEGRGGELKQESGDMNKTAAFFYEQLETRKEGDSGDGGELRETERTCMQVDASETECDVIVRGPIIGKENDDMEAADMCYDSVVLPTLPHKGSDDVQEARLECTETYIGDLGESGELITTVPAASPSSTFFQSSNMDIAGSTVAAASWAELHSAREESGCGPGPSSSDDASPGGGNSLEERAFIDSLCDEPLSVDDPAVVNASLSCPSYGNRGVKITRFETIQSSGASDPENEYSSVITMEDMNHAQGKRTTSEALQRKEKAPIGELSLRSVLSDPITGAFLDDAMVALCGHSFGSDSLQRVMETHSCLRCGASVLLNTLVPNFALRAAVLAYKHEDQLWQLNPIKGTKRRREQFEHPEGSDAKGFTRDCVGSAENTYSDSSRPKGVQFPFAVSDRVLIKGNKRTPERFVGREAVIMSQCLNGWYLVRTLDTGESVRLQYRSLQKLGEMELPFTSETELFTERHVGAYGSPLHIDNLKGYPPGTKSASDFGVESGSPANLQDNTVVTSAYPCIAVKDLQLPVYSSERASNAAFEQMAVAADTGQKIATLNVATPTNSVQELLGDQGGRNKNIVEDTSKPQEGLDGQVLDSMESLTDPAGDRNLAATVGDNENGNESFRARSRRSALNSKSSTFSGSLLQDSDPYRKVYTSGSRRHGKGDSVVTLIPDHMPADTESFMKRPNCLGKNSEKIALKGSPVRASGSGKQRQDMKLKSANEILQIMRKDMLKLEKQIPLNYQLQSWRAHRVSWRRHVKGSRTVSELGAQVGDFRYSLLLTTAGGMSDEEWEVRIALIIESGDVELLVSLWGRLYSDVDKWLESRPNSVKGKDVHWRRPSSDKVRGLQKQSTDLSGAAMSTVHMTTAATLAAVDAVAGGQQDPDMSIKTLLASTMKLLQQQNRTELSAVREVLEWEKRHIAAKLAHLEGSLANLKGTSEPSKIKGDAFLLAGLLTSSQTGCGTSSPMTPISQSIASVTSLASRKGYGKEEDNTYTALPAQDADGEATDMSDSD